MEINWSEVISVITQFMLIPILPLVTAYVCALIKKAIRKLDEESNNQTVDKYLYIAQDALISVVSMVTETYVKELKANGKFDLQAQQVAMQKAIDMFNTIVSEECKDVLEEVYGDYNAWIHSQIESIINASK